MNLKTKYLILSVSCSVLFSCHPSCNLPPNTLHKVTYQEVENTKWLIGKWQNKTKEGISTEIWEKKNDSTLAGLSYFVSGKDTLFSETISIEQRGTALYYVPTVKDQNNGQPVKFTLTHSTAGQLVFENPEHDFPQKITYTEITKDSLLAVISGLVKGKEKSTEFPMSLVK